MSTKAAGKHPRKSADKIVKPGAKGSAKPRVILDALSEIRKMKKGTNLLLPQSRVMLYCKEIMNDTFRQTYWVTPGCLGAIHTALEAELLYIFETAHNAAYHAGRVTLMQKDMKFAERILAGRKGVYMRS